MPSALPYAFTPLSTSRPPSTVVGPTVTLQPNPADLPGTSVLGNLANGLASWVLIAAVIGILVGAVMWAFGHYSQNYQQAYNGRRGVMVSALAGLLVGAAPYIVNFFLKQGQLQS